LEKHYLGQVDAEFSSPCWYCFDVDPSGTARIHIDYDPIIAYTSNDFFSVRVELSAVSLDFLLLKRGKKNASQTTVGRSFFQK
jgi:hypothetical protein